MNLVLLIAMGCAVVYAAIRIAIAGKAILPPRNVERVVYYSGHPRMGPMREGELRVIGDNLVFRTNEIRSEVLSIPLSKITGLNVELQRLAMSGGRWMPSEVLDIPASGGASLVFGRSETLVVRFRDTDDREHSVSPRVIAEDSPRRLLPWENE